MSERDCTQHQPHLAMFYADDREYLDGIMRFISPALEAGEPVAAALPPERAALLRERARSSGERARSSGERARSSGEPKILDAAELGRNPARIIPAVQQMLAEHENACLHYVSEPIWAARSDEEIRETIKHEALINLAWPCAPVRILCPYDAASLRSEILADVERTHPHVIRDGEIVTSELYEAAGIPASCDAPLSSPPPSARSISFGEEDLYEVRALVGEVARTAGLESDRVRDLRLVASELSTNAIRHGHGVGSLHVWGQPGEVVCQVQGAGEILDPLAGRRLPAPLAVGGHGLWIVNQLCDLVEIRTGPEGTTVRAHVTV